MSNDLLAAIAKVDPSALTGLYGQSGGATPASGTETTLWGYQIPTTISGLTTHTWTAGSDGLFHTDTNLQAEWEHDYGLMLAGQGGDLTAMQRMEGNAEAVFENTGLKNLSSADQERDREDVQRELDAIGAAQSLAEKAFGINPSAPLSEQTYQTLQHIIQSSPELDQLAIQGHGLNNPPASEYQGYTNDFQNNVDNSTLYIGGGEDNGDKAIADLMDDTILTHTPFPAVWQNGQFIQLNQNGDKESTLATAVQDFNQSAYDRVYDYTDFAKAGATHPTPDHLHVTLPAGATNPAGSGQGASGDTITSLDGYQVPDTLKLAHTWVADSNGLYHTSSDLAAEWKHDYQMMLDGRGGELTAEQRLEGNAEAVFENTGLKNASAADQQKYREDAQREFDAIGAAMRIDQTVLGIPANAAFTDQTFKTLENTIQSDPALEELAVQGHGLNKPPSAKYDGYTNDFQNNVDNKTKDVGGGIDNGEKAIADLFDDTIMTHAPFPSIAQNGKLIQLNQNADNESSLAEQVAGINQTMFYRVYLPSDFKA